MLGAILYMVMSGGASALFSEEVDQTAAHVLRGLDYLVAEAAAGIDIRPTVLKMTRLQNPQEDKGMTVLHLAAAYDHPEAIEALVAAGASLEARMSGPLASTGQHNPLTPLKVAVGTGKLKALRALIAAGVDLEATSSDGATSLHVAARRGDSPMIEVLWWQREHPYQRVTGLGTHRCTKLRVRAMQRRS